ncbi:MAG: hypothetical protein L0Y66_17230 [Myxococcaceae bacterium]|nr:hypothetical protein [Myxococcaceae bacterium]MCI0670713.1 hypothetical protein [Myxococcaceae bacterium]
MHRRILFTLLLVGAAGCATTQAVTDTEAGGPQQTRERLINRSEFNVATCEAAPSEPIVSSDATVVGALVASRPFVLECLVDPKTRGAEKETTVVIDTTVTDAGAQHQVTGTNLTPEGTRCVEAALARTVKLPALEKGAEPVKGQAQVVHVANVSPTVTWGNNEASDIVGAIRLAQPTWCDCYAGFTQTAPHTVKAWVKALKGTTSISEVVWTPVTETKPPAQLLESKKNGTPGAAAAPPAGPTVSPEEKRLTECLSGKLQQLQLTAAPTQDRVLPYTFEFVNSRVAGAAPNATPELAFRHLDALRASEQAQSAMASGDWTASLSRFNDLAVRYNKRDKKVAYKQVKDQCATRVKASNAWLAQVDEQVDVEKRMVALAQEQAAKAEGWTEVAAKTSEELAKTEAARKEVLKLRDDDVAACKKLP